MNSLHDLGEYSAVKKFNIFEFYKFSERINDLSALPKVDVAFEDVRWQLYQAIEVIDKQLLLDSILLPPSRRAASELKQAILDVKPDGKFIGALGVSAQEQIPSYKFFFIRQGVQKLEAVLANDMPGISSYVVAQKGIYNTEDLIDNATRHLPRSASLPGQSKTDIKEAGRCLAFELSTASAFHMWRAVEVVMGAYYEALTGKTFKQAKIQRNWGTYIKALQDASAETKVTEFLDHIRKEYRNPNSHPEENVDLDEALNLFSAGCSSINQLMNAIEKIRAAKTPEPIANALTGVASGLSPFPHS